ncbi:MAG: hypothetical protein V3V03_09995 [Hyphomonadaceae bacterium]
MALLPLGFVAVAYFNPGFYGEEWTGKGTSILGTVYGNYVARNVASGLIMLIALWQRSAPMLIIAFFMRIFSDIFDTGHNFIAGTLDIRYMIDAGILITVCSFAIYKLWDQRKAS